jgi:hypothetical protein
LTPLGIDLGTVRLVVMCLNHSGTPGPIYIYIYIYICVCVCVCVLCVCGNRLSTNYQTVSLLWVKVCTCRNHLTINAIGQTLAASYRWKHVNSEAVWRLTKLVRHWVFYEWKYVYRGRLKITYIFRVYRLGFEIHIRGLVRLKLEGPEIVDRHFNQLKSEGQKERLKERRTKILLIGDTNIISVN